jgi:prophage antirepressor-like protein
MNGAREKIRLEDWNGHTIRFVEKDGQWWAVAADVCKALDIENVTDALGTMPEDMVAITAIADLDKTEVSSKRKSGHRKTQNMNVLSELGVYRLIMRSNKPEAEPFQRWVFQTIKTIREALGYEQWKVKAFTDSVQNHHLNMDVIKQALKPVDKVPYVKAHSIANKCIANIVGEAKAIGKDSLKERFPQMIPLRDEILTDTAKLMEVNDRFNLGVSISKAVYRKYGAAAQGEGAV